MRTIPVRGGGDVTPVGLLVITKDKEVRIVAAKVRALSEVLKAAIPGILEFMRGKGRGKEHPLGVIRAYRLVKEGLTGVQSALIGAMAGHDPDRLSEMAEGLH